MSSDPLSYVCGLLIHVRWNDKTGGSLTLNLTLTLPPRSSGDHLDVVKILRFLTLTLSHLTLTLTLTLKAEYEAKIKSIEEASKNSIDALTAELSRCKEEAALVP
jgi:hypothetical protein